MDEVHLTIETGSNGPLCEPEQLILANPEALAEMFDISIPKRVHGVQYGF